MSEGSFRLEKLDKHDRSAFDCGTAALNTYLQERAGQDTRRSFATCFVAVDQKTGKRAGYYTLSMGSLELGDLPKTIAKRLPRYAQAPVARMGRLAIDKDYQGQKLGSSLLGDAVYRVAQSDIGVYAMVADAKDEEAAAFYEHFGFQALAEQPLTLFLPISQAIKRLK